MWIAICLPFMLLGVAIAVLPVTLGSLRFHRADDGANPLPAAPAATEAVDGEPLSDAVLASLAVACPLCSVDLEGVTVELLVASVQEHAWRRHGIPSPEQVLESARIA